MASTDSFEAEHVHAVYNEIAQDFSRTRHSRWPFVERWLDSLPTGSLVLDAGTGNGKYLGCRSVLEWDGKGNDQKPRRVKGKDKACDEAGQGEKKAGDVLPVGFDMSEGLLGIASGKGHEVVRGDCVDLRCWRRGAFNHAISIATIHHFATPQRRVASVKQMILSVLPPTPPCLASPSSVGASSSQTEAAQLLIVVWSLEQDPSLLDRSARRTGGGKKGAVPIASSQPGHTDNSSEANETGEKDEQDVFVPWERQEQQAKKDKAKPRKGKNPTSQPAVSDSGSPADSHPASNTAAVMAAETSSPPVPEAAVEPSELPVNALSLSASKPTFNRYYHLFRHYELSSICAAAASQLALAFSAPSDYILSPPKSEESEIDGAETAAEVDGWEAYLEVQEERWERENWVVELAAGWRERKA